MIFKASIKPVTFGSGVIATIAPLSGIYSMRFEAGPEDSTGYSLAASMIATAARQWASHLETHICGVTGTEHERKRAACINGYYMAESPVDRSLVAMPCEFSQCKNRRDKINSLIPDVRFEMDDPDGVWPEKLSHYLVPGKG